MVGGIPAPFLRESVSFFIGQQKEVNTDNSDNKQFVEGRKMVVLKMLESGT